MLDLEFDTVGDAEALRGALKELWGRVQTEGLIGDPRALLVENIETRQF